MVTKEEAEMLMKKYFPKCPLCNSDGNYEASGFMKDYIQYRSCGAKWQSHDFYKSEGRELKEMELWEFPHNGRYAPLFNKRFSISFWQDSKAIEMYVEDIMEKKKLEIQEKGSESYNIGLGFLTIGLILTFFSFIVPWAMTPFGQFYAFARYDALTNTWEITQLTAFFLALLALLALSYFDRTLIPGIAGAILLVVVCALGFGNAWALEQAYLFPGLFLAGIASFSLISSTICFLFGKEPGKKEAYVICPYCGWINRKSSSHCEECGEDISDLKVENAIL